MEKTGKKVNTGKYIDPLSDSGFKILFGREAHKDILIAFLNELFKGRKRIVDLVYNKNEYHGPNPHFREGIYDLTCTGEEGEQFIIEVQREAQPFFIDRAIYYTSVYIHDQGPKGVKEWDFKLREVYLIALMDFSFSDSAPDKYLHWVQLREESSGKAFYDKLNYTFIEMPKFVKLENELKTDEDRWLYVLKNMSKLRKVSANLRKPIFTKLFSIAEVANLSKKDRMAINREQMARWDEYARKQQVKAEAQRMKEEGRSEGRREGRSEAITGSVKRMLLAGEFTMLQIAKSLDVTLAFVRKMKKSLN